MAKTLPRGTVTEPLPRPPAAHPVPPIERIDDGVGSTMIASLPSLASGADVYSRQFYRGSKVPYRRYLPISLK